MSLRPTDQRGHYEEALEELSEHGESAERVSREPLEEPAMRPDRADGSYGERNWEWPGVQHGPASGKAPTGGQSPDELIRESVHEALSAEGDLDASKVTVDVRDGEVSLEGTVADRREKKLAERIAEELPGVRGIHNRLRLSR